MKDIFFLIKLFTYFSYFTNNQTLGFRTYLGVDAIRVED